VFMVRPTPCLDHHHHFLSEAPGPLNVLNIAFNRLCGREQLALSLKAIVFFMKPALPGRAWLTITPSLLNA
jgi:hypothetical protein